MRIVIERMSKIRRFSGKMLEEPIVVDICDKKYPKKIATFKSGKRVFEGDLCATCVVEYVEKNKGTKYLFTNKKCCNECT